MASRDNHAARAGHAPWVALGLSAAMLALGVGLIDELSIAAMGGRLAWPMLRLLAFIAFGLALGQIIEATGWTHAFGRHFQARRDGFLHASELILGLQLSDEVPKVAIFHNQKILEA